MRQRGKQVITVTCDECYTESKYTSSHLELMYIGPMLTKFINDGL